MDLTPRPHDVAPAPAVRNRRKLLSIGLLVLVVAAGGVAENSGKAQASIFAVVPLMLFLMTTVLMVQLTSLQRLVLVALTHRSR